MDFNGFLNGSGWIQPAIWAAAVVVIIVLLRISNIFRYIPNNQVGIVEKLWTTKGSIDDGFIALNGEAGYEPEVLRGGLHVFFPFMYRIHKSDLVTVGQGKIAYVFARDGAPLGASQVLGANDTEDKSDFQDARRFLLGGGQKGPQRKVLREGTYAINTTQFAIITDERVYGHALSERERDVLEGMQLTISERWGFSPLVLADRPGSGRDRYRARRSVAASRRNHRARSRDRPARQRNLSQQFPGAREIPQRRWLSRPAVAGHRRGHLVHQPVVRDGGGRAENGDSGRQCRRRHLLYRPAHRRRVGRTISSRRARPQRQPRRLEGSAAAGQIRLQHLSPARSRSFRRSISS